MLIYYDATTVLDGLEIGDLAGSPLVEVEGVLESASTIRAERIELEAPGLQLGEGEEIELTGFVTDFVSVADFRVLGIPVDASGADIDDDVELANGELVEIEGTFVGGVLIAEEVEEADDDDAEVGLAAEVTSVDLSSREIGMLGITVQVIGQTRIEDEFLDHPNFGLDDIAVGDWLEVRGREVAGATSTIRATRITRHVSDGDVYLQGRVTFHDLLQQEIEILGVDLPSVDLSGGTLFFDELDLEIDIREFIQLLIDGGEVVVRANDLGAFDPGSLDELDELEFELDLDDDDD